MSRKFDIILFGATGFTGQHTIPQLNKFCNTDGKSLKWAVAGRSEKKLKDVLEKVGNEIGTDLTEIPIILADLKDEESIKNMTSQTKMIINCCGPYRFFGETVVKACVDTSTHHVDVSGEPQYMELMQLKYNDIAKEKGIYIVSACGFDSIPTDLGITFLQNNFKGTLNSVETYLTADTEKSGPGPLANYGTWESAVYGLAYWHELRPLRSKLYPERLPSFKPKLKKRSAVHKSEIINSWCLPFLGSDRSVAMRSQRYFYDTLKQRPVQIECYMGVNSLLHVFVMILFGGLFKLLCGFAFGRKLLLTYPKIFSCGMFSNDPPQEETIKNSKFAIYLYGQGWSDKIANENDTSDMPMDKSMICKVKGTNPGYGATCIALVLSAIMILTEKDKLPNKGGVYPPGAAFAKTSMIEQLNKNGLTFEVVSEKALEHKL